MIDLDLTPYNLIALSTSGGKDSEVTMLKVAEAARKQGVLQRVIAIHSATGAEWSCTEDIASKIAKLLNIPLYVVHPKWTIPDYIEHRLRFPDMRRRFCTSLKTSAIDKLLRKFFPATAPSKILSVTGERREESSHRAKLSEFEPCTRLTAGQRQVFHYRPILDYELGEVWEIIRQSGLLHHPAYDMGNERLSCALCIFACNRDLWNGARDRPDLKERYLRLEEQTGFTFRHKESLKQILAGEKEMEPCPFQVKKQK